MAEASATVGGLRRPFFVAAVVLAALIVLIEVGMSGLVLGATSTPPDPNSAADLGVPADMLENAPDELPGSGIRFLAFVDGLLLFTVLLMGASLLLPLRLHGRIQGVATFVVALVWIVVAALASLTALAQLMLMIGLFLAPPFGTAVYLAVWGGFPKGAAAIVLGLLLLLKVVFGVLLVLAQPRFLRMKGLVLLVVLSVVLQLVLGFLHGFMPRPVVAIGDQAWAVVTGVVALIWAVAMLVGTVPAIVNAIRASRPS